MKPKTKKPITQSQLARKLGVHRQVISRHVKHDPDAPALHDVDGWMEYLAAKGREGSLPLEMRKKIGEQKLRLLRAQADKAEDEKAERRKELLPSADVNAILTELILIHFWGTYDRLTQELPPRLAGLSADEIHTVLRMEKQKLKKKLDERVTSWLDARRP